MSDKEAFNGIRFDPDHVLKECKQNLQWDRRPEVITLAHAYEWAYSKMMELACQDTVWWENVGANAVIDRVFAELHRDDKLHPRRGVSGSPTLEKVYKEIERLKAENKQLKEDLLRAQNGEVGP